MDKQIVTTGEPAGKDLHISPELIASLMAIANAAISHSYQERRRKEALSDLKDGYDSFKDAHGYSHVERDTPEWSRMMEVTAPFYTRLQFHKNAERNARRRLETAIANYNRAFAA